MLFDHGWRLVTGAFDENSHSNCVLPLSTNTSGMNGQVNRKDDTAENNTLTRSAEDKPTKERKWRSEPNWFITPSHRKSPGSKSWFQIEKAWQKAVKSIHWRSPQCHVKACNIELWFSPKFVTTIRPTFPMTRAAELFNRLRTIGNCWQKNQQRCLTWAVARTRFQLSANDKPK